MVFLSYIRKSTLYAVRIGKKPGIYDSWDQCAKQVKNVPNSVFRKFKTREDADQFLSGHPLTQKKISLSADGQRPRNLSMAISETKQIGKEKSKHKRLTSFKAVKKRGLDGLTDQLPDDVRSMSLKANKTRQKPNKTCEEETTTDSEPLAPAFCKDNVSLENNHKKYTVVYVDGCCENNGGKGGDARGGIGVFWGADDPKNVAEPLIYPRQTNIEAEIHAACKAVEQALEQNITHLEICTDSYYTIDGITKWYLKWKLEDKKVKNIKSFDKLYNLTRQLKHVRWTYLFGSAGIDGIDQAEKLSQIGAEKHENVQLCESDIIGDQSKVIDNALKVNSALVSDCLLSLKQEMETQQKCKPSIDYENYTVVYTNGCSLESRKTGHALSGIGAFWGVNDPRNVSEPLNNPIQTKNAAEINAVCKVIEQALVQKITHLEIRTDNVVLIKAVTQLYPKWQESNTKVRKDLESFEKLFILMKKLHHVRWTHVFGRVGTG